MNKKLLFLAGLAPLVAAPALVVASCSSSTTDNSKQQANEAANRAKTYLESKSYLYADKKPSELKGVISAALKPSQNFGFTTEFLDDSANDKEDDGIKSIKIVTKRGSVTSDPVIATLKVKSAKAAEDENETKVDELLNLDQITSVSTLAGSQQGSQTIRRSTVFVNNYDKESAPEASKISEFIDASKDVTSETWKNLFLKETNSEVVKSKEGNINLGWKALVKKDATVKDVNFIVSNVHQTQIGSILAPSITFDLQLNNAKEGDAAKTSGIVQVNLVGFRLDPAYKEQVKTLFDQASTEYGTLYSPIVDDSKSVSKKASEIKNATDAKEELKKYLLADWNIMGGDLIVPITIDVTIEDVVSANDAEGSLTVKFKFDRKINSGEGTTQASTTKEIKLFGFQVVQAE